MTHSNELDADMYLPNRDELYLKRLIGRLKGLRAREDFRTESVSYRTS